MLNRPLHAADRERRARAKRALGLRPRSAGADSRANRLAFGAVITCLTPPKALRAALTSPPCTRRTRRRRPHRRRRRRPRDSRRRRTRCRTCSRGARCATRTPASPRSLRLFVGGGLSALSFAFGVPAASSSVGSEDNAAAAAAAAAVADTGDGAGASPPACSNVDANSAAKAKASPDSRWCTSLSYRSDPCVSMRWRIALAALSSSDVGASGRPRSHVMNDAAGGGGQLRRELAAAGHCPHHARAWAASRSCAG